MSDLLTGVYSDYRPSGVEWIHQLPQHWANSTLGFECSVKARLGWKGLKAEEYVDSGFIFLATPNIKGKSIDFDDVNYITRERYEESPEIMLEVGDVLVTKDGSTTGTTNLVRYLPAPTTVNSSIAVLRSFGRLDSRYLHQFFTSDYVQNVINRMRGGMGVPHLFQADLKKFFIPVPPWEEQTQIAKFLDYETARIDALIEKQQQLIALLKEKRQAVISHAVTKGLNPDAPMRDSGVEWIGAVPSHWGVLATSRVSDLTTGGRDTQDAKPDGEYPFFVRSQTVERIDTYSFEGEGVLTSGDGAGVGKIYHHHIGRLEFHQRVYLFHGFRRITGRYFFYFLREHLAIVALAGNAKSTVDSLRRPMLRTFPVCLPPVEEQKAITEYLDETVTRIDALISKQDDFRELLQERRTALISAAVTGKIDVRAWRAPQSKMEEVGA